MISAIVYLCGIFLIIITRCHGDAGKTNIRNDFFIPGDSLNGYECSDESAVSVENDIFAESLSECAKICTEYFVCVGFFYQPNEKKCVMCSYLFNPTSTVGLKAMAGSRYYNRSECYGWVRGDTKLRIFFDVVTRDDAQTRCEANNGTLVKIRDRSQMKQLSDVLTSCSSYAYSNDDYWTDGIYDSSTGTYTYSDGTAMPMDSPDYWDIGAPDMNEPCTRLRYTENLDYYRWNDYRCDVTYRFICEYKN